MEFSGSGRDEGDIEKNYPCFKKTSKAGGK